MDENNKWDGETNGKQKIVVFIVISWLFHGASMVVSWASSWSYGIPSKDHGMCPELRRGELSSKPMNRP